MACSHVPEFDFAAARRLAAAGRQRPAIRAELHRVDAVNQRGIGVACADDVVQFPRRL